MLQMKKRFKNVINRLSAAHFAEKSETADASPRHQ
ncbi:hypothetical protein ROSI111154_07955 [Rouxiella silvae]